MDDGLIQQIVNFVKEAAPVMWQAAYKQTYVTAINYFLVFLGFAVLAVFLMKWYYYFVHRIEKYDQENSRNWSSSDRDNLVLIRLFLAFFIILFIGADILILNSIIARIINPEYYAIQNLLSLIP